MCRSVKTKDILESMKQIVMCCCVVYQALSGNVTAKLIISDLRGDAGQNAPPGGNSRHTTYTTPQKVVAGFLLLVLHSFPTFYVKSGRFYVIKVFVFSHNFFHTSLLALQRGKFAVKSHILAPISTKMVVIQHQSGWKDHVKYINSGSVIYSPP